MRPDLSISRPSRGPGRGTADSQSDSQAGRRVQTAMDHGGRSVRDQRTRWTSTDASGRSRSNYGSSASQWGQQHRQPVLACHSRASSNGRHVVCPVSAGWHGTGADLGRNAVGQVSAGRCTFFPGSYGGPRRHSLQSVQVYPSLVIIVSRTRRSAPGSTASTARYRCSTRTTPPGAIPASRSATPLKRHRADRPTTAVRHEAEPEHQACPGTGR